MSDPTILDQFAAVRGGVEGIKDFKRKGGVFTNEQNRSGHTTAMSAARRDAAVILAYAEAGGPIKDGQENDNGRTAAMYAAMAGAAAIEAFHKVGGIFDDRQDNSGNTAAMYAAMSGPRAYQAYKDAGGPISDRHNKDGWTAEMITHTWESHPRVAVEKAETPPLAKSFDHPSAIRSTLIMARRNFAIPHL